MRVTPYSTRVLCLAGATIGAGELSDDALICDPGHVLGDDSPTGQAPEGTVDIGDGAAALRWRADKSGFNPAKQRKRQRVVAITGCTDTLRRRGDRWVCDRPRDPQASRGRVRPS